MICPHCKKENFNEKAVVCAYCKQNLQKSVVTITNPVIEEQESTEEVVTPNQISITATVEKESKAKKVLKAFMIVFLSVIIVALAFVMVVYIVKPNNYTLGQQPTETTTKSAAQIEQEEFDKAYSKVQQYIKSTLRDPESLQIHGCSWKNTPLDEAPSEYSDMSCKFVMEIDMSARNGFGGLNRVKAYALCYDDGSVKVSYDENSTYYLAYKITYYSYKYVEK